MANIFRLAQDENLQHPDTPGSTQYWRVTDSEDPATVAALVLATVPAFDEWDNPFIDARNKHEGGGVWTCEVRYGPIPPLATGLTIWEIDTTGGREKRYQSLATNNKKLSSYASSAGIALTSYNGAINVSERGPEGVDIAIPKMSLVGKRKYQITAPSQIPTDYVESIENLTATINQAAFSISWWSQFLDFDAGELLFLGAVVVVATERQLEIDHKFEASRDRTASNGNAVQLVGFTGTVDKPGWDYAWISYRRSSNGQAIIPQPIQYQTEKVYLDGDFTRFVL